MKKFVNKEFLGTALKTCVHAALAVAFVMAFCQVMPSAAWCGDLFSKSESILGEAQGKLVHFAMALFPVSLIVLILNLFFTKDDRKIGLIGKACIVVCVATALIMVIDAGTVLSTLEAWFKD